MMRVRYGVDYGGKAWHRLWREGMEWIMGGRHGMDYEEKAAYYLFVLSWGPVKSIMTVFRQEIGNKTQCKIRVNLGFTVPYKREITVLHGKAKNEKTKNIRCWKNQFKKD